jgi:hypothetical protein
VVAALRCLCRRAVADGYREPGNNLALKVDKPARFIRRVVDIETLNWFYQLNTLPIQFRGTYR